MKYTLIVAWLVVRESVRALVSPVRLLLYLPRRAHWRQTAAAMLAEPPAGDTATAEAWARGAAGRGRLFISAGETSGEAHAAKVVRAVRDATGDAEWTGFGGPQLQAEGVDVLYPLSDRAVMGLAGVFKSLPFILGAVRRFLQELDRRPPSLVVLVDYPGLHLVLAKLARSRGIPVLHYIAPQYWAWGPWRMRRYRRSVSATLTILPFEATFFRRAGIPCQYVGHPLLDRAEPPPAEVPQVPYLCLLPGSRRREIDLNLPGMLQVASALRAQDPDLQVLLPHVDPRRTLHIKTLLVRHGADFVEFRAGPIQPVVAGARLVLAKSGTGSLEACLLGVPTIVVYRLPGALATFFARNCLSVPFIASANLVAGREVVPEFCFRGDHHWDAVAAAAALLWQDGDERQRCLAGLAEVRARLGAPGASARVARWILPFCRPASKEAS